MTNFKPIYHYLPPANWMNDPNGLIEWKGQYHLFYQHNPEKPDFGLMVWGHAVSQDLVHWQNLPVALHADMPYDQDGCWTGCTVDRDGIPTLVYTGRQGDLENVCMAVSHDDLQTFTKPPVNRLNILPPKGEKLEGFRDPCVWQEKDGWYMLIGSGFAGKGGAALLYRSTNFLDWDFLDPLLETSDDRLGTMWECPNFFPMGDRHVLIVSAAPKGYAHYFTGQYKDHYLMPGRDGVVDYGGYLYAPQVFKDSHDRFILFGWVWEGLSKEARLAAGWAGVQSLPRELFLSPEGMLCNRPVSEVAQLRGESFSLKELQLPANSVYPLSFGGECLEIDVIFSIDAGICGVYLACSDDDREKTIVGYDLNDRSVFIDCNQSSMSPDVQRGVHKAQLVLPTHETLRLHIFLDRSVIEIFVNDRLSMTSRIYPTLESSHRVRLFSKGIGVTVKSLDIWRMNDIGM